MRVTKDEIVMRLRADNRAKVSRDTGLAYRYLRNLIKDEIKNPGSQQMDILRAYYITEDVKATRT